MKRNKLHRTYPSGFWAGLFIGGLAGLATVAMLSTKEGRKVAKRMGKVFSKMIAEWEERLAEVEKEAEEKKKDIGESLGDIKEAISQKVTEGKSNIIDKVHQEIHQAAGLPKSAEKTSSVESNRYFKKHGEPLK